MITIFVHEKIAPPYISPYLAQNPQVIGYRHLYSKS